MRLLILLLLLSIKSIGQTPDKPGYVLDEMEKTLHRISSLSNPEQATIRG